MVKIDKEKFRIKYGKIRILEKISERHPVRICMNNDRNRSLMIKFKYGNMSVEEENLFHENVKKIIYKIMHMNNVMMDWDDVYQEIWKKITRCRHTWNESKGTMVSTWITIVSNSVINTLRHNIKRYNSRYCLYEDLPDFPENSESSTAQEKFDSVSYMNSNEDDMCDSDMEKSMKKELFHEFIETLDDGEKFFMDAALSIKDDILDSYDRGNKNYISELKQSLGYDEATYNTLVYNIRKKFCSVFDYKFDEYNKEKDDSGNEFIF